MKLEKMPEDIAAALRRMSGEEREITSAGPAPESGDTPLVGSGGIVGPLAELQRQLAEANEFLGECNLLARKAEIMAAKARHHFFEAERRYHSALKRPNAQGLTPRAKPEGCQ